MQGDKVGISVEMVEQDGKFTVTNEFTPKPQFMLDGEYEELLVQCVKNAMKAVCKACYPEDKTGREMLAKAIAKKAMEEANG